MAEALIKAAGPFRRLLADKGYDANHLRRRLAERGTEAVIPSKTSRRTPIRYDTIAYKDRNRVERMWCSLKDFRRVATRYDKLAANYLSGVLIAAACAYWLIESVAKAPMSAGLTCHLCASITLIIAGCVRFFTLIQSFDRPPP